MWESREHTIVAFITTTEFLLSLCLVGQYILESGEDDNDIMTNRNGFNADAVGQSSF